MSKFLKFIVHIVILLAIVDVLALTVPTFMGITTAVVDSAEDESNLPVGSVTYARSVSVNSLQVGDSILVQDNNSVYRYRINSVDTSTGVYNVYDQTNVEAGEKALTLRNTAPRVIITIGYIGYLVIATQSIEGLIILGLIVLVLIILFILSELWRKDKKTPEELAQEEAAAQNGEAPLSKREMKKALKQKAKQEALQDKERAKQEYAEATRQLKEEAKARKQEAKRLKKEAKKRARTGGFIEDYDPIEAELEKSTAAVAHEDLAATAANEELKKQVAAATAVVEPVAEPSVEPSMDTAATQNVVVSKEEVQQAASEAAATVETPVEQPSVEEPVEIPEEVVEPEPVEIKKMAIPVYTAEELLAKAQAAGHTPEVIKDEQVGVTLLDYSDIIIEGTPSGEEQPKE